MIVVHLFQIMMNNRNNHFRYSMIGMNSNLINGILSNFQMNMFLILNILNWVNLECNSFQCINSYLRFQMMMMNRNCMNSNSIDQFESIVIEANLIIQILQHNH